MRSRQTPHIRGQAALELIMTYGWAILATVVVLGSMAYFTGFYVKLTPDTCAVGAPFACVEYQAQEDGTVLLGIQNGAGWDMEDVNVTLWCNEDEAQQASAVFPLVTGQERIGGTLVTLNCPIDGAAFKAKIFITYTQSGESVSHVSTGDMRVAVE